MESFWGVVTRGQTWHAVLLAVALAVVVGGCNGTAASTNWAGYRTSTGGVTRATATWVQPRLELVGLHPNVVGCWVGLSSPQSRMIVQIGTEGYRDPSVTDYRAWYELYPKAPVTIDLAVNPTDTVTVTVASLGAGRYRLTLANDTTHARFDITQVATEVGDTAGAIVVEGQSEHGAVLAGFGSVRFTRCAFDGRPIGSFALSAFDIFTDSGVAQTTTSGLSANGTSFTVTRR